MNLPEGRAWRIEGGFGLDRLELVPESVDGPAPGEVLVELEAWSLNYRDLLMVTGKYNPRQRLPLIPGSDAAGHVVAVGHGVESLAKGDLVAPIFAQSWMIGDPTADTYASTLGGPLDGVFRSHLTLPESGWIRLPSGWTARSAATLPCAGVTAWNALFGLGSVRSGDRVLVLGTGGVALFGLQLASARGAEVVVTSSRDDKLERARQLGARWGVNYRDNRDWGRAVRELTDGGVDHVIELGGAATLSQSLQAVRPGATISVIGNLGGNETSISVIPILMRQLRIQGVFVGPRTAYEGLIEDLARSPIDPVIDRVFPFSELPAALASLREAGHFGKICLE